MATSMDRARDISDGTPCIDLSTYSVGARNPVLFNELKFPLGETNGAITLIDNTLTVIAR